MGKKIDLSGQTFGQLKVIQKIGIEKTHSLYECLCVCGKIVNRQSIYLLHSKGQNKNCGHDKRVGVGQITLTTWGKITLRATKNGWNRNGNKDKEFTVTIEEAWDLFVKQEGKCSISGVELIFAQRCKDRNTASLDRVDSNKGYTSDNIQWVHKDVNNMKQNLNQKIFLELCTMVSDHNV